MFPLYVSIPHKMAIQIVQQTIPYAHTYATHTQHTSTHTHSHIQTYATHATQIIMTCGEKISIRPTHTTHTRISRDLHNNAIYTVRHIYRYATTNNPICTHVRHTHTHTQNGSLRKNPHIRHTPTQISMALREIMRAFAAITRQ